MKTLNLIFPIGLLLGVILWFAGEGSSQGQSVAVSMRIDTNQVTAGQTTTLHIVAQVVPSLRANASQIFSWYVDVLNTNVAAAPANYASMLKSASDNDPQTSSKGIDDGPNRRGIYDTFLSLSGAGVANPVELLSIPVTGLTAGKARFLVKAGSGVGLSSDFLVMPISGAQPYTGGDYSAAFVDLTVIGSTQSPFSLQATPLAGNGGPGGSLKLTFTPSPGWTYTVESRTALGDKTGWQALPGAPHNSGSVTVTNNTGTTRFFRVRASSP